VIKTFKAEFTRPVLRSGVMDGQLLGTKELLVLADLPSMDVLRGKILGVISAPASTLVRLLAEPGARLARVVRSKADAAPAAGV
jgi:large subunit ribosomal protein L10